MAAIGRTPVDKKKKRRTHEKAAIFKNEETPIGGIEHIDISL